MENKYLGREDAPIGPETWKALDSTMTEAAKSILAGRRLLHIEGPYGLGLKAVPLQDIRSENGIITSSFVPVSWIYKTFMLGKRDIAAAEKEGIPTHGFSRIPYYAAQAASGKLNGFAESDSVGKNISCAVRFLMFVKY